MSTHQATHNKNNRTLCYEKFNAVTNLSFFQHLLGTRDGFGLGTDPRLEGFPTYSMIQNEATGKHK